MPKGSTRGDANEKMGELEKKVRQEVYVPPKMMPLFSEVADNWLASKKPNIREGSYQGYKGHVENHLKPFFGRYKISQINFDLIERYKVKALGNGVTAATLRRVFSSLNGILSYAVKSRYLEYNPVKEVEKPKDRRDHEEKDEIAVLQPEQIRALFDAAGSQKERVLYMMATLTGMREGELLGVQWHDINWPNRQVHVRRTYNYGRFYKPKTKTSRRKIDLASELVSELRKWKLACPKNELNLVFPNNVGKPWHPVNMVKRQFLPALKRAKLPRIRFHDLRHTYASLLIDQGENIKYVQTQLGHSKIQTTLDIYGHLLNEVNTEAANRLGRTIFGDGSKTVAVDHD